MSYFGGHKSLSVWAREARIERADAIIEEDANKRPRLEVLHRLTGLPIVKNEVFTHRDVEERTGNFSAFLSRIDPNALYALRLNPPSAELSVVRNRGLPIDELLEWVGGLAIDRTSYRYEFEPHIDSTRAVVLAVTPSAVVGEVAHSGILDLVSGINEKLQSYVFRADSDGREFGRCPHELSEFVGKVLDTIRISDDVTKAQLSEELKVEYTKDYPRGYYEAIGDDDDNIFFTDFNRVLGSDVEVIVNAAHLDSHVARTRISGQPGSSGSAIGRARVLTEDSPLPTEFNDGDVLVCRFTSPELLQWMIRASAIVTDVGGVLSHAAIIARELNKPCIVGTRTGTTRIMDGSIVEVRAADGLVIFH